MKKDKIEKIVRTKIEKDEYIGEKAGGSGHLSFVSYNLKDFRVKKIDEKIRIDYKYEVVTETEFTYYPDNPPYAVTFKKLIVVDQNGVITEETEKQDCAEDFDKDWEEAQKEIMDYLTNPKNA